MAIALMLAIIANILAMLFIAKAIAIAGGRASRPYYMKE